MPQEENGASVELWMLEDSEDGELFLGEDGSDFIWITEEEAATAARIIHGDQMKPVKIRIVKWS